MMNKISFYISSIQKPFGGFNLSWGALDGYVIFCVVGLTNDGSMMTLLENGKMILKPLHSSESHQYGMIRYD